MVMRAHGHQASPCVTARRPARRRAAPAARAAAGSARRRRGRTARAGRAPASAFIRSRRSAAYCLGLGGDLRHARRRRGRPGRAQVRLEPGDRVAVAPRLDLVGRRGSGWRRRRWCAPPSGRCAPRPGSGRCRRGRASTASVEHGQHRDGVVAVDLLAAARRSRRPCSASVGAAVCWDSGTLIAYPLFCTRKTTGALKTAAKLSASWKSPSLVAPSPMKRQRDGVLAPGGPRRRPARRRAGSGWPAGCTAARCAQRAGS